WGVSRADRLGARSEDPLRPVVERVAELLGVDQPMEIYRARSRVRDVEVDATEPAAVLIATNFGASSPRQEVMMHLGRQLGRLRARTHGASRLSAKDLDILLASAVRIVFSNYGQGLAPEATMDDLSRRIARVIPRKQKRSFEDLLVA